MAVKISRISSFGSSIPCFVGTPRIGASRRRTESMVERKMPFSTSRCFTASFSRGFRPPRFSRTESYSSSSAKRPSFSWISPIRSMRTSYSLASLIRTSSSKFTLASSATSPMRARRL